MLLRVVREFQPIITRRNYNVRSISELCCCGDGLDHTKGRRRGRKCNRMSNSIWGYNQTTFFGRRRKNNNKSHTIHLRLRHPTDHTRFLGYEDVAGTLAHELAHCEHAPHNQAFYQLMDTILDEHAALMASGLSTTTSTDGSSSSSSSAMMMLPFEGTGVRLGGRAGSSSSSRRPPQQQQHSTTGGGQRLGGTSGNPSRLLVVQQRGATLGGRDANTTTWMSPAQAAAAAAEARRRLRLRGDRCCRPCVIEIDDDDDDEPSLSKRSRMENRENTAPEDSNTAEVLCTTIDLTSDGEDDTKKPAASEEDWACHACTFQNTSMALACSMCSTERKNE